MNTLYGLICPNSGFLLVSPSSGTSNIFLFDIMIASHYNGKVRKATNHCGREKSGLGKNKVSFSLQYPFYPLKLFQTQNFHYQQLSCLPKQPV